MTGGATLRSVGAMTQISDASVHTGSLPQTRQLVTAVPGPRSRELHAERLAQVSDGFGVALPVFVPDITPPPS